MARLSTVRTCSHQVRNVERPRQYERKRRHGHSDTSDVGRKEVDAVTVEVAARPVVVLGGARVGMASQDLCVAERNAGVQGIGDRGMAQGVRADVSGNLCDLRDPDDHPVGIAAVDRIARDRPKN